MSVLDNSSDTLSLFIWLKDEIDGLDNSQFGMQLLADQVYCNEMGSQINYGSIYSDSDDLFIQVDASQFEVILSSDYLFTDSIFGIQVKTTDVHGNLDNDQSGELELQYLSDEGELISGSPLIGDFLSGIYTNNDLKYTGSDTVIFKIIASDFLDTVEVTKYIGKHFFFDDFNMGLFNWSNTSDWVIETNSITNNTYLKHNLSDVEGSSYISSNYDRNGILDGKMVWNLTLGNGDFDPTSSNRFWYYLMASDSNLLSDSIAGYAVGVNFQGSTDSLSLWKIDQNGTKNLLLQSDFNWDENENVSIEVIKEANVKWQLVYSENDTVDYIYTDSYFDQSYNDFPFHGLVFQYSSSRAGELWLDELVTFQLNSPPLLQNLFAYEDSVVLEFTEDIANVGVENISNYQLNSDSDTEIQIETIYLNANNSKQIIIKVNRFRTASYTISVTDLFDMDGSEMLAQSFYFSYAVPAQKGDIVINEILFDASPVVALPEADFVEIYNNSIEPFSLKDWKIVIGTTVKTLPDSIIYPNEYVIITSGNSIENYAVYGKTIGVLNSTSLTNSGKPIQLISSEEKVVDSVYYNPNWITDPEKEDGGWSIERRDPNNLCGLAQNWTVSLNEMGGTPGLENSVFSLNIDHELPRIIDLEFISQNQILVHFSEELKKFSVIDTQHWYFQPVLAIDSIVLDENLINVELFLNQPIQNNQSYKISVIGL